MDIIPIQASSVPCERVFSSGKETMAPRRSRISAHLMECLQILKFSIRKGRALKFTEGMAWADELRDFEAVAQTAPAGEAEA
jgi:hAT family C-terminal dimerisation region